MSTIEERIVLQAARTAPDKEALRRLSTSAVDWRRVVALSEDNSVVALVRESLRTLVTLPPEVEAELRALFHTGMQQALLLEAELQRLLGVFGEAGVAVLALKGPVLARRVYGAVHRREYTDLDLLIRPADYGQVRGLLLAAGYALRDALDANEESERLRTKKSLEFTRDGLTVEIHWALVPLQHAFQMDVETVWARAEKVAYGSRDVLVLATVDELIYLCAHGTAHSWERLKWIVDVAESIRAGSGQWDPEELRREMRRLRIERVVGLGLVLAAECLDAPVPPALLREARRDPTIRRIAAQAPTWLFNRDPGPLWPLFRLYFDVALRLRPRDRARVVAGALLRLLRPNEQDYGFISLPPSLRFAYYAVRPVRLVGEAVRRASRPR